MKTKKLLSGVLFGASITAATLAAGTAPASAASAPCSIGTAPMVLAGQHVQVLDQAGTAPSSCVRLGVPYTQASGANFITHYGSQMRDTAQDNQYASALVRVVYSIDRYGNPVSASGWTVMQAHGTESWAPSWRYGSFTTRNRPIALQFAACRSTSATGQPSNACNFSLVGV